MMKSKLLQKESYGFNKSHAGLDGQHEDDSFGPTKGHENPRKPANPAYDAEEPPGNGISM
jgi:hypothetical protein